MTTIDAINQLHAQGKLTAIERARLMTLPEATQLAAVSAVTEREFRHDLDRIRVRLRDLTLFINSRKIRRDMRDGMRDIFMLFHKHA